MEPAEYALMDATEDRMWWYRGLRTLVAGQLARGMVGSQIAGSVAGPVLDAGCGTGGMLALLGTAVAGHPTLGLEYDPVAASLAAAKSARPLPSVLTVATTLLSLATSVSLTPPMAWALA